MYFLVSEKLPIVCQAFLVSSCDIIETYSNISYVQLGSQKHLLNVFLN